MLPFINYVAAAAAVCSLAVVTIEVCGSIAVGAGGLAAATDFANAGQDIRDKDIPKAIDDSIGAVLNAAGAGAGAGVLRALADSADAAQSSKTAYDSYRASAGWHGMSPEALNWLGTYRDALQAEQDYNDAAQASADFTGAGVVILLGGFAGAWLKNN